MQVGLLPADARQTSVGEAFAAMGIKVQWITLNDPVPDIVVFPMPVSTDGVHVFQSSDLLTDWWSKLKGRTVYAGRCSQEIRAKALEYGVRLLDHFDREEEVVLNVIPTVEGALQLAMSETPFTIHGSRALICGYGRIGKLLAQRLQGLGAKVCVCARKERDFAWCHVNGLAHHHIGDLAKIVGEYRLIFNTVPHLLFDGKVLDQMDGESLLIDLASLPGGVDFSYAAATGKKTIQALGLPGKVAPRTAGEIICNTILGMYKEENTFVR